MNRDGAFGRNGATGRRHFNLLYAGKVLSGQAVGICHDFARGAFGCDFTPVDTRTGADVDHIIGGANGIFIMLHDDDSVTQIS